MKRTKFNLGIAAFAIAMTIAIGFSPKAKADLTVKDNDPNSQVIDPANDCDPSENVCGYRFTDDGKTLLGTIPGDYNQ